jgi:MYXO-CTERM domain-containing protein
MRPNSVWLVFAALAVAGFAELLRDSPFLPPYIVGLGLLLLGVLAGLRRGADASSRLVRDLSRTNSCLAEQNDQLSDLNFELLSRMNETVGEEVHQE